MAQTEGDPIDKFLSFEPATGNELLDSANAIVARLCVASATKGNLCGCPQCGFELNDRYDWALERGSWRSAAETAKTAIQSKRKRGPGLLSGRQT